ncbi:hypothetical protein SLS62_007064 [Diatrype stigma]|uniref:Short-chain dehydrogenase n=1 Tax=Diatrype stigma TaxID=117547 RepID=A0AAN9YQL3_9PEZI
MPESHIANHLQQFEFLRQISSDPKNLVVGIVRDKPTTDKRVAEELSGRSNIHILQADITDYDGLKRAAAETSTITGGAIDYLIANAGYVSLFDEDARKLFDINVIGNIHLFNLFVPLLLKGNVKKAIVISSGHADIDMIAKYELANAPLYSASKAAMNVIVAKFHAQYKKDGILFLAISPGAVEVGHNPTPTQEQIDSLMEMGAKFQQYAPHFKGPSTPDLAVRDVRNVWEKASIENGDGGAFVSHYGNKQWL